jgi:hypothetical protein
VIFQRFQRGSERSHGLRLTIGREPATRIGVTRELPLYASGAPFGLRFACGPRASAVE